MLTKIQIKCYTSLVCKPLVMGIKAQHPKTASK